MPGGEWWQLAFDTSAIEGGPAVPTVLAAQPPVTQAVSFSHNQDPKPTSDGHLGDGSRMKVRAKALRLLPECRFLTSVSGCSCI